MDRSYLRIQIHRCSTYRALARSGNQAEAQVSLDQCCSVPTQLLLLLPRNYTIIAQHGLVLVSADWLVSLAHRLGSSCFPHVAQYQCLVLAPKHHQCR